MAICVFDLFCNIDSWHMVPFQTHNVNIVPPFLYDLTSGLVIREDLYKNYFENLNKEVFWSHNLNKVAVGLHIARNHWGWWSSWTKTWGKVKAVRKYFMLNFGYKNSDFLKLKLAHSHQFCWSVLLYLPSCMFIQHLYVAFQSSRVDLRTKKPVPHIHKEFWLSNSMKY